MRRFIWVALSVMVTLAGSALFSPVDSQDATSQRLDDLELRVVALEGTVASIASAPVVSPATERFTIDGEFTLFGTRGEAYRLVGTRCVGLRGYDDIYVGAQVRVTDGTGAILGIGNLGEGWSDRQCTFTFSVEVPRSDFYTISAGSARRGGPTYSFDEMESMDWEVQLSMG